MAVDPVPWFVEAPAKHSAEVARTLAYMALGGSEGVGGGGDFKPTQLPVPGGSVRVMPGSAGILNRSPGALGQAYMGRSGEATDVAFSATGSGGGRSDLLVLRVDNPKYGGDVPADPVDGPYIALKVIPGVPAGTRREQELPGRANSSSVPILRLDIPASTGTYTDAMITDLRQIAVPKSIRQQDLTPIGATSSITSATEIVWPAPSQQVRIPDWANEITVKALLMGLLASGGSAGVEFRLRLGGTVFSAVSGLTTDTTGTERLDKAIPMRVAIPEAMRGTTQTLVIMAKKTGGAGSLQVNARTTVEFDTTLAEKTI